MCNSYKFKKKELVVQVHRVSSGEERELQRSNQRFYRQSMLEDVFFACFRLPEGNEEGRWMTAAEMFRVMSKQNPTALRGITAKQLSHRLSGWGFQYKHTNHGNYYLAVH